jgi:micrococcal nuclease
LDRSKVWVRREEARRAAEARAERQAETQRETEDAWSDTGGGTDTYTGCRAYGPGGTSVDNQGRRYTKIPC